MKAIFIFEGELTEDNQFALSKAVEKLANNFNLKSYLDDVIEEDNICNHNNTVTNLCSDCDHQEIKDYFYKLYFTGSSVDDKNKNNLKGAILSYLLPEIRNLIIDYNLRDSIYDIAGSWSKSSYKILENGLDDEIVNSIFYALSMESILKNKRDLEND